VAAVRVTVWDERDATADPAPALLVHNIFTWGSDPVYGFAGQRPLADSRRLLLMDRRGYGDSPDIDRSDVATDAEDVVGILDDESPTGPGGAHLVGHGNGAVAVLLAAARRPGRVRSLALLQPSAFTAAADHPVVAALLDRVRTATAGVPAGVTPQQYLRASTEGMGLPMPEPTPPAVCAPSPRR
jgi:pimeloyl-ACP methyl ester carboxylesterase